MNNPMNVAFEKCLVEIISDPPPTNWKLTPAPNQLCAERILAGFHKCEEELKENVSGFIDVMKMMTETYDLNHNH